MSREKYQAAVERRFADDDKQMAIRLSNGINHLVSYVQ
jgi:hypothetical protein